MEFSPRHAVFKDTQSKRQGSNSKYYYVQNQNRIYSLSDSEHNKLTLMSANMEGGHTCYQALGVSIKVSIISTRFYTPPCIFYNDGLCHSYKFSSQAVTCPKVTILQTLSCFCPQINTSVTVIFLLSTDDHTNYNGQRQ